MNILKGKIATAMVVDSIKQSCSFINGLPLLLQMDDIKSVALFEMKQPTPLNKNNSENILQNK